DFVQRRGRRVGRNVPADALRLTVGADDHGQRVPADEALDAALDLAAARHRDLFAGADGVDLGRCGRERHANAVRARAIAERVDEADGALAVALADDVVERVEPLVFQWLRVPRRLWVRCSSWNRPTDPYNCKL